MQRDRHPAAEITQPAADYKWTEQTRSAGELCGSLKELHVFSRDPIYS